MVMGEVYIGLIPATIPTISQAGMLYLQVYNFLLVLLGKNVDICLIPATLPPITQVGMVDCLVDLLIHVLLTKILMVMIGAI